jgi:glycine/D-amino acid oxidase-like deaminating enzyme
VFKIAVIGGGVAGATAALYFAKAGLNVTLFEKRPWLIGGPPFCHLHAGGNLYPQITDQERLTLLRQSIDLIRYYPFAIDYRPTLVTIPKRDATTPEYLQEKLLMLQDSYANLVATDPANEVLGDPKEYFRLYYKSDLKRLSNKPLPKEPTTLDSWVIPAAKFVATSKLKEPLALVMEFGLNIFALSGALNSILRTLPNLRLRLRSEVVEVQEAYSITYRQEDRLQKERFDFLINAAGFETGRIDAMLGFRRRRFVEFKAAFLAHWPQKPSYFPEIIFHGQRGSDQGMGQFTPYSGDLFQIHAMTKRATLFENGLVAGDPEPILAQNFLDLIKSDWNEADFTKRTKEAIKHISEFIPGFSSAKPAAKPLFGAQQIPGNNPELRAADVSFEGDTYARCEIVKASSVLDMCDAIAAKLHTLGVLKQSKYRDYSHIRQADEAMAKTIAKKRNYPQALAKIVYKK